ncbi:MULTISPECIES: hypothetical protein [unclassified Roseovarius]|uniref:hypothetical protein n=1 Tax=unclassified Roseovarius TaxID=2614913 RepID=UPI00030F0645|nr:MULTISPECIES: hypothetical protein [unclassified Roseovarius]
MRWQTIHSPPRALFLLFNEAQKARLLRNIATPMLAVGCMGQSEKDRLTQLMSIAALR